MQPILDETSVPLRMALADANITPAEIDEVVLVGGSTRVPLVRRIVAELFGRRPQSEINPDEVVALGAAVDADILERREGSRTRGLGRAAAAYVHDSLRPL